MLVSELVLYVHIHERYCIMLLPWDSPWTWLFCFTMVDFIYYWFHRATHGKFLSLCNNLYDLVMYDLLVYNFFACQG